MGGITLLGAGKHSTAVAAFTPADLFTGGYVGGWYDFSDTTNCFSDAGTTQIVNAATVQQINDKSGNGNTMSQGTAGSRPTWATGGYATFDGTADHLFMSSAMALYTAGSCSLFVLAKANPAGDGRLLCLGSSSTATPAYVPYQAVSATPTSLTAFIRNDANTTLFNSASLTLQTSHFDNTKKVTGSIDNGGASTITAYIGTTPGTATGYTVARTGVLTLDRTAIGALVRNTTSSYFAMDLYQLVVVGKILTTQEISDLNTYYGTK